MEFAVLSCDITALAMISAIILQTNINSSCIQNMNIDMATMNSSIAVRKTILHFQFSNGYRKQKTKTLFQSKNNRKKPGQTWPCTSHTILALGWFYAIARGVRLIRFPLYLIKSRNFWLDLNQGIMHCVRFRFFLWLRKTIRRYLKRSKSRVGWKVILTASSNHQIN